MALFDHFQGEFVRRRPHPRRRIIRGFAGHQLPVAFRVRPEVGINMVIAVPIVLMRRGRIKDGIQVNGVDPQILQVIKFVDDPLQISPVAPPLEELMKRNRGTFLIVLSRIPIGRPRMHPPRQIRRVGESPRNVPLGRIVRGIPIAEAFGKNLIPDSIFGPSGNEFPRLRQHRGQRQRRGAHGQECRACGHCLASRARPA